MSVLARNKRATFNYQLHDRFEAGLMLEGWEVKGIMAGQASLLDTHVIIRNGEAWLLNCHITPLANVDPNKKYDPLRSRKLLLHAKELNKLIGKVKQTGMAIVVINFHRRHGKIKVDIALGKGKKLHDKRRHLKEREWQRSQGR